MIFILLTVREQCVLYTVEKMKKHYIILKSLLFILAVSSQLTASITTRFGDGIEAIIFDCDGILVDTEYAKFLAWQEALADELIPFSIEEYMPAIGHSSKNILVMIETVKNRSIPEEVIESKNAKYRILQKQGVVPIYDMIALAKRLNEKKRVLGIKLGLASSASREEILENLGQIGLKNCFDVIVSGSDDLDDYVDVEGKNKPKPYIYIEAAKRLGVTPSKCLVFEDTAAGIEAASTGGMIAIAVPNRFTLQQDFSSAAGVVYFYKNLLQEEVFE